MLGCYAVYVRIPAIRATTEGAIYTIRHAGESDQVVVNQAVFPNIYYVTDGWVYVGKYNFTGAGDEYIELTNRTQDETATIADLYVGVDAVRFVLQGLITPTPIVTLHSHQYANCYGYAFANSHSYSYRYAFTDSNSNGNAYTHSESNSDDYPDTHCDIHTFSYTYANFTVTPSRTRTPTRTPTHHPHADSRVALLRLRAHPLRPARQRVLAPRLRTITPSRTRTPTPTRTPTRTPTVTRTPLQRAHGSRLPRQPIN